MKDEFKLKTQNFSPHLPILPSPFFAIEIIFQGSSTDVGLAT